jgi:hypothetical protein
MLVLQDEGKASFLLLFPGAGSSFQLDPAPHWKYKIQRTDSNRTTEHRPDAPEWKSFHSGVRD